VNLPDDADQSVDNESETPQSEESQGDGNAGTFDVQDRVSLGCRERTQQIRNRQNSQEKSTSPSFRAFGISPALLAVLSSMSITMPTEIQAACIPQILAGEYVISIDSCEAEGHARQGLYR
jgi:ATP-dependent RNA helicase DDX49/DBP8